MANEQIRDAFERVKNDMNELKAELIKLADRINNLAIDVRELKAKKVKKK